MSSNTSITNTKTEVDSAILDMFNNQNGQGSSGNNNSTKPDAATMASDLASLNNALVANVTNQGISLSLDNSSVTITPTSSSVAAASITSNVKTALPGYSLTIKTDSATNNLISVKDTTKTIPSTDGTTTAPKVLANNQWGYAMAKDASNSQTIAFDTTYSQSNPLTSKWAAIPAGNATSPATIKHTETTPDQTNGDSTTVYYGLNLQDTSTTTAGVYQADVTYTVTANILDPPVVEQVTPDTIRQSVSMGGVATSTSSAPVSSSTIYNKPYVCYLTDKGSIYCTVQNSDATDTGHELATNSFTGLAPMGAMTIIRASNSSGTYSRYYDYWFKVDTSGMDGTISTGGSSSTNYNLTITGSKFTYVNYIYIDINKNGQLDTGEECTNLKVVGDTKMTCTAPKANTGTYDLYILNPTSQTRVSIAYQ